LQNSVKHKGLLHDNLDCMISFCLKERQHISTWHKSSKRIYTRDPHAICY